jgi:hypothetical protein
MAGPNRAAGYADYSSDGAAQFNPVVYSGRLVQKFYSTAVFPSISLSDYEGDISKFGDKVIIRKEADVNVVDLEVGQILTPADYQVPDSQAVQLEINRQKGVLVRVDETDAAQSDLDLADSFANRGSIALRNEADKWLLATMGAGVAAENQGATAGKYSADINLGTAGAPLGLTKANVLDWIVDQDTVCTEQDIPEEDRWLVLPPAICGLIHKSDLKDASVTGDGTSTLRNGRLGQIMNFTLYKSNHCHKVTGGTPYWEVLAGHREGLAFASQVVNLKQVDDPYGFGELIKGKHVYGAKVIEGNYITLSRVTKA